MKYREEIQEVVGQILRALMSKAEASNKVKLEAWKLHETDQGQFIEVVETELIGLHEGNFVRYRIKSSEFSAWKKDWYSQQRGQKVGQFESIGIELNLQPAP